MNPPSPFHRRAVILVIDRLGAGMTSAYGNTYFDTEHINRLAAESLVFDFAISTDTNLGSAYQQLTTALLDFDQSSAPLASCLVTDDLQLADHSDNLPFDQVIATQQAPATDLAVRFEETELAQYFAQATQWLFSEEAKPFDICWLHCRGLSAAWDAPYALREQHAAEEDPDPPRFFSTPSQLIDSVANPDDLLGIQQACAAQVGVLDQCLGVLLDQLSLPEFDQTLLLMCSTRGFALGEHGRVGEINAELEPKLDPSALPQVNACFSEELHIPLLIRFADNAQATVTSGVRNLSLVTPCDIARLPKLYLTNQDQQLDDQLRSFTQRLPDRDREFIVSQSQNHASIQTHCWKLIWDRTNDAVALYAKPDDRWETNNVSRRCPGIVESLLDILKQYLAGQEDNIELPEALVSRP